MEIKKVALIGAGAIGSYLIWRLSRLADLSFTVIADGQRGERLREKGLVINGEPFRPMVQGAEETGPVDLIFVTVKYGALSAILPAVTALTDSRTMIISLMNGVDSEAVLEAAVGKGHIVPALLRIASHRERGKEGIDQVTFKEPQGIRGLYYGKPAPLSQRDEVQLEALKAFFARTPLLTHMSRTIESDIWAKFLFNIGQNIPQAIVGCGTGAYADSEHVRFLKERLEEEVVLVAKAKGISLHTAILEPGKNGKGAGYTKSESPAVRHSTLQDLDHHRHTEIDMLCGRMVEMGEALGIPTPYNAFAYHVIKALEEKNDGLFDYE